MLQFGVDLRGNLLGKNGVGSNTGSIAGMHIPGTGITVNLCRRTQGTNKRFRLPQGLERRLSISSASVPSTAFSCHSLG